ncbi:MAG: T9SS type A sorting domain-containing protein [Bacteroidetes bacterium]|nr:T9SS type A sorting domain-containing protein [Bacteroidota bacterium]
MILRIFLLFTASFFMVSYCYSQSIFISTLNTTGETKRLPASNPRFPNYFFEWSVGESSIVTTNTVGNFQVTHGLLQGFLLSNPIVPENGFWYPDEIKIYPNPVITDFSVELLSDLKGVVDFKMYNSSGSTMFIRSINYQGTGQNVQFNISNLPSGTYFLRITLKDFPEAGGYSRKQGGFKIIKSH